MVWATVLFFAQLHGIREVLKGERPYPEMASSLLKRDGGDGMQAD